MLLVATYLQAFVSLQLADRFIGEDVATWYEVDGFDAGAQRLRGDGANPAFATFVAMYLGAVGGVLGALGVDLEV